MRCPGELRPAWVDQWPSFLTYVYEVPIPNVALSTHSEVAGVDKCPSLIGPKAPVRVVPPLACPQLEDGIISVTLWGVLCSMLLVWNSLDSDHLKKVQVTIHHACQRGEKINHIINHVLSCAWLAVIAGYVRCMMIS
jgi:hypothetical protein